jgi:hypothetical protein
MSLAPRYVTCLFLFFAVISAREPRAATRVGQREYQAYRCHHSTSLGPLKAASIGVSRIVQSKPDGPFQTIGTFTDVQAGMGLGENRDWHPYVDPLSDFSLSLQVERGQITPEERRTYAHIGRALDPRQIHQYEMSEWRPWSADLKPNEIRETRQEGGQTLSAVRLTTLWSVSDRILDPATRQVVRKKLAIESHPDFTRGPEWDFSEDDTLFEWGRAGQEEPKTFLHMAQMAALQNVNELLALGGDPERAWVVIGTSDPALKRLYGGPFGMTEFKSVGKNTYFKRKLLSVLEDPKFAPSQMHGKLAAIRRVTQAHGVRLSEFQMIDFLFRSQALQNLPLDLEPAGSSGSPALWLLDRSPISENHFREICLRFGVADFAPEIGRALYAQHEVIFSDVEPQMLLAEPNMWTGTRGKPAKEVFMDGLDAWTQHNPNVNPVVPLVALSRAWLDAIRAEIKFGGLPFEEAIRRGQGVTLKQFLHAHGTRFTAYFESDALAKTLGAFGLSPEKAPVVVGFAGADGQLSSMDRLTQAPLADASDARPISRPGYKLSLTLPQLDELESRFLYLESDRALVSQGARSGFWNRLYRLNNAIRP